MIRTGLEIESRSQLESDRLNDRLWKLSYEPPDPNVQRTWDGLVDGCCKNRNIYCCTAWGAFIGTAVGLPGGPGGAAAGCIIGVVSGFLVGCCIANCEHSRSNPPTHRVQKKQIKKERS